MTAVIQRMGRDAMFGAAFDDVDNYASAPPSDTYLADLLEKDSFIALVALADGEVVGGLAAYELIKFEQAGLKSTSTIWLLPRHIGGKVLRVR